MSAALVGEPKQSHGFVLGGFVFDGIRTDSVPFPP